MSTSPSARRSLLRFHLGTALVAWMSFAGIPLFLQRFHVELVGGGVEDALHRIGPIAWIRARTELDLLAQAWLVAALVPLLVLALTAGFEGLVRWWRLDASDDAWTSLAWAARSWRGWLLWIGIFATGIAVGSPALLLPESWVLLALVPVAVAFLSVVFFAGNADNLRPPTPPARWRLRWPGWFALLVAIAALALSEGVDHLFERVGLSEASMLAIDVGLLIPSLVVTLFISIVWISRATLRRALRCWRKALAPQLIVSSFVQELRFGVVAVQLLLPLAPWMALETFVVPQVQDSVAGGDLGVFWSSWLAVVRLVSSYWWAMALPLAWLMLVAGSRLIVQLDAVDEGAEAAGAGQAGDPSALRSSR